jgi:uncharacterized protein YjbJ (UPF0337 family)
MIVKSSGPQAEWPRLMAENIALWHGCLQARFLATKLKTSQKQFGATQPQTVGGSTMNKEQVTGKVDEVKGKVKEEVGKVTNNPNTEVDGLKDQVKGKAKQAYGDVKEEANKKPEK